MPVIRGGLHRDDRHVTSGDQRRQRCRLVTSGDQRRQRCLAVGVSACVTSPATRGGGCMHACHTRSQEDAYKSCLEEDACMSYKEDACMPVI